MIICVGDVHGMFDRFNRLLTQLPNDATIIQVGDFGFWNNAIKNGVPPTFLRPVYVIDGNHEQMPLLQRLDGYTGQWKDRTEVAEIWPNVFFVPRGTVLTLDGRKVGFLGGGDSIDKEWRIPGVSWFPEETIKMSQVDTLLENAKLMGGVDLLVTHSPPSAMKKKVFGYDAFISERMVQMAWDGLGRPPLICGHMHPDEIEQWNNCYCLPILGYKEI